MGNARYRAGAGWIVLCFSVGACNGVGPEPSDPGAADSGVADSGAADAGPSPEERPPRRLTGERRFGEACDGGHECRSGLCTQISTEASLCTTSCEGPAACLEGWACGPVGTGEFQELGCRCEVSPEACNERDDDCDGLVDEELDGCCAPGRTRSCGSEVGLCEAGTSTCDSEGRWGACEGGVLPAADLCDGLDNDCDPGTADGSHEALLTTSCDGDDSDACEEGIFVCTGGTLTCTDSTGDQRDLCDGLDNDCNPDTPDGFHEALFATSCDGDDGDGCEEGVFACTGGTLTCTDSTGDALEVCDEVDNDCDGHIDEGSTCNPCRSLSYDGVYGVGALVSDGAGSILVASREDLLSVDIETGRRSCIRRLSCRPSSLRMLSDREVVGYCPTRLLAVDLDSREERTISGAEHAGPPLPERNPIPSGMVVEEGGSIYVTTPDAFLRVDATSGERTTVSSRDTGAGPWPNIYRNVTAAAVGESDFLLFGSGEMVRVDGDTGDRTLFTTECRSGDSFLFPNAVIQASDGAYYSTYRYVPWSSGQRGIDCCGSIRRHDEEGRTSTVAGTEGGRPDPDRVGTGSPFIYPVDITEAEDGYLYVTDSNIPAVVRVDRDTGDRFLLGERAHRRGTGHAFSMPNVLHLADDGNLYVADFATHHNSSYKSILRVDLGTGDRELVSSNLHGAGPFVSYYGEVVIGFADGDPGTLLARFDRDGTQRTIAYDVITGTRSEVAEVPTTRDPIEVVHADGQRYRANRTAVVRMSDGATVSDATRGSGPAPRGLAGIEVLPDGSLVVSDDVLDVLLRVEPVTGDRTVLSGVGNY